MDWIEEGDPDDGALVAFQRQHEDRVCYGTFEDSGRTFAEADSSDQVGIYRGKIARWRPATDLDRFLALYRSFGIELSAERFEGREEKANLAFCTERYPAEGYEVCLEQGNNDQFCGYTGFGSDVIFDLDGRFIEQGFWE